MPVCWPAFTNHEDTYIKICALSFSINVSFIDSLESFIGRLWFYPQEPCKPFHYLPMRCPVRYNDNSSDNQHTIDIGMQENAKQKWEEVHHNYHLYLYNIMSYIVFEHTLTESGTWWMGITIDFHDNPFPRYCSIAILYAWRRMLKEWTTANVSVWDNPVYFYMSWWLLLIEDMVAS